MLTHKPIIANAFLGEYRYHSRGTIHPHAKAVGLSLPLEPAAVKK